MREGYFPEATGVLDMWHLEREFKKVFEVGGSNLVVYLKGLALKGGAKRILGSIEAKGKDENRG